MVHFVETGEGTYWPWLSCLDADIVGRCPSPALLSA
jgi:hypothetical protein